MIHRHHIQVSINSVYRLMPVFIMLTCTSDLLRSVRSVCFPFFHIRFITASFLFFGHRYVNKWLLHVFLYAFYDSLCLTSIHLIFKYFFSFSYIGKCFTKFGSFSVIFCLPSVALRLKKCCILVLLYKI